MMHVRPALVAFALAASLAACDAGRSLTEPTFRDAKAAPGDRTGSGSVMHVDNGGTYGSGYNLSACAANTGGAGSGYETPVGCASLDNGGTYGSGHDLAPCTGNTGGAGSGYGTPGACPQPENTGFGESGRVMPTRIAGHAEPTLIPRGGPAHSPELPARADCVVRTPDNGGWVGSGYNYCP
jgi:hypothetical protein